MTRHDRTAADAIVAALDRFVDLVNRGEVPAALGCFTDSPSIVEDLAPFRWQGPSAGAEWLAAMAANAQREGFVRIHMGLGVADTVMVDGGRGYAVFPGDLTYTANAGPPQRVRGHLTFVVTQDRHKWRIEAVNWSREREDAP